MDRMAEILQLGKHIYEERPDTYGFGQQGKLGSGVGTHGQHLGTALEATTLKESTIN
jgi:hypothetical protein